MWISNVHSCVYYEFLGIICLCLNGKITTFVRLIFEDEKNTPIHIFIDSCTCSH